MTTGSEHEKVQSVHPHQIDAGDISERLHEAIVVFVHNEGTPAPLVPTAAHLSLARPSLLALAFRQFLAEAEVFKALNGVLGFGDAFNFIGDDERDFLCRF